LIEADDFHSQFLHDLMLTRQQGVDCIENLDVDIPLAALCAAMAIG
jgi:hypothetical protein